MIEVALVVGIVCFAAMLDFIYSDVESEITDKGRKTILALCFLFAVLGVINFLYNPAKFTDYSNFLISTLLVIIAGIFSIKTLRRMAKKESEEE